MVRTHEADVGGKVKTWQIVTLLVTVFLALFLLLANQTTCKVDKDQYIRDMDWLKDRLDRRETKIDQQFDALRSLIIERLAQKGAL
jgi:uncharacterized membrane-anchored protein YhcB (DUF1043 family)